MKESMLFLQQGCPLSLLKLRAFRRGQEQNHASKLSLMLMHKATLALKVYGQQVPQLASVCIQLLRPVMVLKSQLM
ncbi:hypothetical protein ASG85_01635 [Paenibacillus sp. Soil724D2]|nr:hypothetical protein ASG85_01635 [Paenibacillus sp. Soil724D2]